MSDKPKAYPSDGDYAFPAAVFDYAPEFGLTKREYFAAMAMQACIQVCRGDTIGLTETKEQMFARNSVRCADALIAALNTEPQP